MRVALVGAGALGSVYGAHLATRASCEVILVTRAPAPATRVRLEGADGGSSPWTWSAPAGVARVPEQVDVVLAAVRYEDLDRVPERAGFGPSGPPVVVLTPMLPRDEGRLEEAMPGRVVAAMPGVVAYRNEQGAIRYWLPRMAVTSIDRRGPEGAESELVRRLERAGIRARAETGVLGRNVATTVSFIPLAMALDVAGGVDAFLADAELTALAFEAAEEGRALGRTVGTPPAWAAALMRFVGPVALRLGVRVARARMPEAVAYVEHHFGRKLHAQNARMAAAIVDLAETTGVKRAALVKLRDRLDRIPVTARTP